MQARDEQLLRDRLMLLVAKACEIVPQSFKNAGRQLFKIGDRLPTEAFSLPFGTLWFRSETLGMIATVVVCGAVAAVMLTGLPG